MSAFVFMYKVIWRVKDDFEGLNNPLWFWQVFHFDVLWTSEEYGATKYVNRS